MSKTLSTLLAAGVLLAMSACGGKPSAEPAGDTDAQAATAAEPQASADSVTQQRDIVLGGHTYQLTLRRYVLSDAPVVADELDQQFYDNAVEVVVCREGTELLRRTFTKDDFADFLTEADRQSMVLMGMAYNEELSDAAHLSLAAQVAPPGMSEGPAFTVAIATSGGTFSIVRDLQQDVVAPSQPEEP